MEPRAIASILEKIARSSLSVTAYFQRYKVPFGRSQYFQYKARLAANGLEGLVDGRSQGNHRTLTTDAQAFIRGVHEADSTLSLRQIADRLESSLGIGVDPATVSRYLRAAGLKIQWPRPAEAQTIISSCGGFEIIGALALPLITLNGWSRSANNPLGNALEQFCGSNYQHHTLDKFLRELKYLGISEWLLREQVSFWRQHWSEFDTLGLPFLCYYVDGNTKPLWSQKRVKQNKVTMLGRVMGCLEQVFVHDAFGHPVYLETYAGKAPLGEHILGLFEKIEAALEGPGPALKVRRVIVMDAASNGVATLRAFAQQEKYHYITALDDNQWNPRKVMEEGRAKRYYYGEATLRACRLELEDSREKGYLVEVRAVRIDWDYGKRTVLITSLPREAVGASLVVKAYFDRWPSEELQFKRMKSFACLNRVAGYGKKKLPEYVQER